MATQPNPPGRLGKVKTLAEKKAKAAATSGTSVRPGTAKNPAGTFKVPGTTDVKVSGTHVGTVNVAAIRSFLRSKGYDLPKTNSGTAGRRLLSAINDWGVAKLPKKFGNQGAVSALMANFHAKPNGYSGRQKPSEWNTGLGSTSKVKPPTNSIIDRGGNPIGDPGQVYDPGTLAADSKTLGSVPIDELLSKSGAQALDPKLADALAGLQYDSQLRDLAHQGDVNKLQGEQNSHDIGSWYDQALKSLGTAKTRDAAITQAGLGSVKSADQAILASLGGDASGGASTVASAEQQGEGTLAALGTVQDQYNSDIAPIVTQERAGQLSTERARGSQRASDLAVALANAKGERGGSVASHLMDIRQYNNTIKDNQLQRLLEIKAQNKAAEQQTFNNQLAVQQANLAALATGAKIAGYSTGAKKPAKGSFADTPASVKAQIASTIFNDLHGAAPKTPAAAQAIVMARLRGAGWSMTNPNVAQYGKSILSNWSQSQS
jgi:hypothetical protein